MSFPARIHPPLHVYASRCRPPCMAAAARRAWVMEASVSVSTRVYLSCCVGDCKPFLCLQLCAHCASPQSQTPHLHSSASFPEFPPIHAGTTRTRKSSHQNSPRLAAWSKQLHAIHSLGLCQVLLFVKDDMQHHGKSEFLATAWRPTGRSPTYAAAQQSVAAGHQMILFHGRGAVLVSGTAHVLARDAGAGRGTSGDLLFEKAP